MANAFVYIFGFTIVTQVAYWVLGLFPQSGFSLTTFSWAIFLVTSYMWSWDWLFPIHELFALLTMAFIVHVLIWSWSFGRFVLRLLRGGNV